MTEGGWPPGGRGDRLTSPGWFVREIRPQLLVAGDRSPIAARLMFVSSDRTWPLRERKPLTSAFDHLLVGANGLSPRSRSLLANGPGSDPMTFS
jgi:hypothetical protein